LEHLAPRTRGEARREVEHLLDALAGLPQARGARDVAHDELDRQALERLGRLGPPAEAADAIPARDESPDEVAPDEPVRAGHEDDRHGGDCTGRRMRARVLAG